MEVLLKGVRVFDRQSEWNGTRADVQIEDGVLRKVAKAFTLSARTSSARCLSGKGLGISPGWVDMRADFCDPGELQREDLSTGLAAARAGGFTDVLTVPSTSPAIQTKSEVSYLQTHAKGHISRLHVVGALTRDCKGKQLNDLYELHESGVCAYGDGHSPIADPYVLLQALRYTKPLDKVLIQRPEERRLAPLGVVHEGMASLHTGLKGIPSLAEHMMITRDIQLLDYVGGARMHVSLLSSADSITLLRAARKRHAVSTDVSVQHLWFDEKTAETFDSQYRIHPPYRSQKDRKALLRALQTGVIDAIVSGHRPWAPEHKQRPFGAAEEGTIALPIVFSLLNSLSHELPLDTALAALYAGPRQILGWDIPIVRKGQTACFTLFDTEAHWTFDASTNPSKSSNSPFFGKKLKGVVVGLLSGAALHLNPWAV